MIKLYACLVLYDCNLSDSKTFSSLYNKGMIRFFEKIYIYLNSKDLIDLDISDENIEIIQNPENKFLCDNYIDALDKVEPSLSTYLMVLDQDTVLNEIYFSALLQKIKENPEVSIYYPKVSSQKGVQLSPMILNKGFPSCVLDSGVFSDLDYIGINSASVFKVVDFINFNILDPRFPLDYLDYVVSYKVFLLRLKMCVLDVSVQHELSVSEKGKLSDFRMRSILQSEKRYFNTYRKIHHATYRVRLMLRVLKSFFLRDYPYKPSELLRVFLK